MRVFILARASKNNPKQLKYLLIVDGQTEEAYFKTIFQRFKISAKTIKRVAPSGVVRFLLVYLRHILLKRLIIEVMKVIILLLTEII